jgi:hypothetical protein
MWHLLPEVSEAEAVQTGSKRGLLKRLLARGRADAGRIQCVWFPFYFARFALTSPKGPGAVTLSIEGWSGAYTVIDLMLPLIEGPPPGEHFPPKLDPDAAERAGRQGLLNTILAQRSRGHKPEPGERQELRLVQCPLWVYYYPRIGTRLDIRVVDGLTGELLGNRTRLGVLEAFVAHHRSA